MEAGRPLPRAGRCLFPEHEPVSHSGVSTYKRGQETGPMAHGHEAVPDLLIVLDSSRSMDGPKIGTKTHKATLAAFKACSMLMPRGGSCRHKLQ